MLLNILFVVVLVPLTRVFSQGSIRSKPSTGAGSFMRAISKGIDPPATSASNAKVFNATDIDFLNKKKVSSDTCSIICNMLIALFLKQFWSN